MVSNDSNYFRVMMFNLVCAQQKLSPKATSPNHDGSLGPIPYQVRNSTLADVRCELDNCEAAMYTCVCDYISF